MKSMTGFGRASAEYKTFSVTTEVKTLNHRFMEVILRLPRRYQPLEERIRRLVQEVFSRGKVEVSIRITGVVPETAVVSVDEALAEQILRKVMELKAKLGLSGSLNANSLFYLKEVFLYSEPELDPEQLWKEVEPPLKEALEGVKEARAKEGEYLKSVLKRELSRMKELVRRIEELKETHLKESLRRLEERILFLLRDKGLDPLRLHQEAAILAERTDFTEELDRLKAHIKRFEEVMEEEGPVGRKLDFLCQEMFREVNTLSNKACSAEISHLAVEVKGVIEKLREQVQNIE